MQMDQCRALNSHPSSDKGLLSMANNTLVINLTRVTQQVDVRHADNKLDTVQIMAQGRIELRSGMTVDTRWEQSHPGIVKIIPSDVEVA